MRKIWLMCLGVLLVCLFMPVSGLACTSFAVYSGDTPVYGMNFDARDDIYSLRLDQPDGYMNVFSVHSLVEEGLNLNVPTMNENGFFTTLQAFFPSQSVTYKWEEGVETIPGLAMWTPYIVGEVQELRDIAKQNPPVQFYTSSHSLYADMKGDAAVLEIYEDALTFTDIQGDYLLMTNFPNLMLDELPMEELEIIMYGGTDRYQAAKQTIEERKDGFDIADGFAVLKSAVNENFYSPTVYSVVCDPANRLVYVAVYADFEHIWKVSMDDRTVQTHQGFHTPLTLKIGGEGVRLSDLYAYADSDRE